MAEVYDFTLYRLPRLLRSISQQAGDVARLLDEQERHLDRLEDGIEHMSNMMADFDGELEVQRERLNDLIAKNRKCQDAAMSGSIARMIAARDRLQRSKAKPKAVSTP